MQNRQHVRDTDPKNSAMWLLTDCSSTNSTSCLYSDFNGPVLWCYQLAICRLATLINTASFYVMCGSKADTGPCLWSICCTVKYTTVATWYHSKELWRKVRSYSGSAKHAYSTYGHMRFIRPFLNSLYETVNIICIKTSCISLLSFIHNTKNISVTSDLADQTTAIKRDLQLWYTKWGTACYQ